VKPALQKLPPEPVAAAGVARGGGKELDVGLLGS